MNKRDIAIEENKNSIFSATCKHYWVIAPNYGPTSWGYCKNCGAQREFSNLFQVPENLKSLNRRNNKVMLSRNV